MIHGLNIALSDTDLVVWAADASLEQDYLCARCGVDVRLDASHNVFRHPETRYCSESLSLRKGSLLYVQRLLECGQHLQLLKRCRKMPIKEGVGEIFLDSFRRLCRALGADLRIVPATGGIVQVFSGRVQIENCHCSAGSRRSMVRRFNNHAGLHEERLSMSTAIRRFNRSILAGTRCSQHRIRHTGRCSGLQPACLLHDVQLLR